MDLKGFFMGICREFLYRLERAVGVEPGITRTMCALQGKVSGRVITAHGLSDTNCGATGRDPGKAKHVCGWRTFLVPRSELVGGMPPM